MFNPLKLLTRIGDKAGSLGAVVSAMGCAMCFPAIANIAVALGMGFLGQWEGLFVNTLFPLFASLALVMNLLGWFSHRQWHRSLLGSVGPILVLLSLYPWFEYDWSSYATYTGLGLMVAVSIWDMVSPANKHCDDETCAA
jgi:mercuric ion transport protein